MKKVNYLFILLALAIFSCEDDVDNLTDIKVSTTLTESFNVTVAEEDPLTQSIDQTLNVGDNDDIKDVLSKVENYEISDITFTIRDYVGANDIQLESAMVTFQVNGSSNITASVSNLVMSDIAGTEQDLPFNEAALTTLGETLLSTGGTVNVTTTSTVSGAPVSFTMEVNIKVRVTVDTI